MEYILAERVFSAPVFFEGSDWGTAKNGQMMRSEFLSLKSLIQLTG